MKKLSTAFIKDHNIDIEGKPVEYLWIKQFQFNKNDFCVKFKYSYSKDDDDFLRFNFFENIEIKQN